MSAPTLATIKKLFALPSNRCAFPDCNSLLVEDSGTVKGEICHIRAANPGGPRYDSKQSEEDCLPNRIVYYPGYFGAFFGFGEDSDTNIFHCLCAKESIVNYLTLTYKLNIFRMAVDRLIVSYRYFPKKIVDELLSANAPNNLDIIEHLRFKKNYL